MSNDDWVVFGEVLGSLTPEPASAGAAAALGGRLFGPLARDFVACVRVGAEVEFWEFETLSSETDTGNVFLDPSDAAGGPRDKRPARAGFIRPARLPLATSSLTGSALRVAFAGGRGRTVSKASATGSSCALSESTFDKSVSELRPSTSSSGVSIRSVLDALGAGVSIGTLSESGLCSSREHCVDSGSLSLNGSIEDSGTCVRSGVVLRSGVALSFAGDESPIAERSGLSMLDLVRCRRFIMASGTACVGASPCSSVFRRTEPPFSFIASFCLRILSLNSSTLCVFFGPPVLFRAALPWRMLFLSSSGAT